MLQVPLINSNKEEYIQGLKKRGIENASQLLDEVIYIDEDRKKTQGELDDILNESNTLSRQIGNLMKEGKRDEAEGVKQKTAELKEKSKSLNDRLNAINQELKEKLYNVPNIPNEQVPAGNTDEDNEILFQVDQLPELSGAALPHWDLIEKYDIIDFELGNKITGAGFPVYKGKGARLQRGMVNYFLDSANKQGYQEVQPPVIINEDSGYGTGQLPDKEGQMYQLEGTDMFLIPTAEVPITNLYRGVILKPDQLPIKNVGFTPCFRKEAGSWGSHVRGLNRLHQFDKVQIVQITHPDKSYETLDGMISYIEGLLKSLELPYRILRLCGGDLGFTSAITYDFEVYSAAQEKWLEVSSVSNFETYQANRLKLRFKDENKKTQLLHTLNGSALALPRIMAAILENNQSDQGVALPKVLHDYCGFDKIS